MVKLCAKDNREIKDNDIIEMRYEFSAENSMFWEPLRIRDDKIKPQFFTIANSVWDTIQNPVSEDFIRNSIKIEDFIKSYDDKKQINIISEMIIHIQIH